jgi:hypothetical protein
LELLLKNGSYANLYKMQYKMMIWNESSRKFWG